MRFTQLFNQIKAEDCKEAILRERGGENGHGGKKWIVEEEEAIESRVPRRDLNFPLPYVWSTFKFFWELF